MFQTLLNGISDGMLYALLGLGFGLILNVTRVFHLAHGAIYMSSGFTCYFLLSVANIPLILASVLAVLMAGAIGTLVQIIFYEPVLKLRQMRAYPSDTVVVVSLGAYIIISNSIALLFGNETKILRPEIERSVHLPSAALTWVQIGQIVTGIILFTLCLILAKRGRWGRILIAVADDPELASVLGFSIKKIHRASFAAGSILAGSAGVLRALDVGITPFSGLNAILAASIAAIWGGRSSFLAPMLGGIGLGIAENLLIYYISSRWAGFFVYSLLLATLILKPNGLLTVPVRED